MIKSKKFIFLVQGEGRGHMTQAISLYNILTKAGHQVTHIFIGKSKRRTVPEYFLRSFNCPVEMIDSPNFVSDKANKRIRLIPSVIHNIKYLPLYYKSLKHINRVVKEQHPDFIINFYEFLCGFYYLFFRPEPRHVPVGHQFLAAHPLFPFAPGFPVDRFLFKMNNRLNSVKAYKKLALSFGEYNKSLSGNLLICPPLLRSDLKDLVPTESSFILAYMVNDGYSSQLIKWHETNKDIEVHCFWDKKGEPEEKVYHRTLTFHQLNAQKFMDMMARCRGLVTTAGFESICEAMYLGKPVLMIPVEGQYEQACNAIDAVNAGAGIRESSFNISSLLHHLENYQPVQEKFRAWLDRTESIILTDLIDSTD